MARYPQKGLRFYVISLVGTTEAVAAGSAEECAAQLGMTLHSFYSMISKVNSGANKKYEVQVRIR